MKIRKLKVENHSILGNIELDFTNEDGTTANSIILAGENGVGKSLILNLLYDIEFYPNYLGIKQKIFYEIEFSNEEVESTIPYLSYNKFPWYSDDFENILYVYIDYNEPDTNKIIKSKIRHKNGEIIEDRYNWVLAATLSSKVYKFIFSDSEINFLSNKISNITSKDIYTIKQTKSKSDPYTSTDTAQLLVDIQTLDALDFNRWAQTNMGNTIDETLMNRRMKRFTNAFNYMFPSKKYKTINNIDNRKEIIFEENGLEMNINQLSSGEKQIVFRGGFLLQDKEALKGALVLIDEPEISLHPNWQLKILSFYKKLFTNDEGEQTSQMFIATHSPFIIHNANRNDDKVIILKKGADGKAMVANEPTFYGWTTEKLVVEAFNITNIFTGSTPLVLLEGETDEKYFNKALDIFGLDKTSIVFAWVGRINERGKAENTGDTALNNAKIFLTANPNLLNNKLVLLYDCDTSKPEETDGLLLTRMLPKINDSFFKKGIENQLVLENEFNKDLYIKEVTKTDEYDVTSNIRTLDKTKLCNYICDSLGLEEQKKVLANLKTVIDKLIAETKDK